jgi:hypothetical protein
MIARTQGVPTYHPKCRELAEHFLNDAPRLNTAKNIDALARLIQIEIEDWITYESRHDVSSRVLVCGATR